MSVLQRTLRVPMRDGTELASTLWLPRGRFAGPVLLYRTPYGRETFSTSTLGFEPADALASGYAVLAQDVRGRGDSSGRFGFIAQERDDGRDTLRWLVAQPWSDGRVATIGASYPGRVQLRLAADGQPLRAMIPSMTGLRSADLWWPGGTLAVPVLAGWVRDLAAQRPPGANGDGGAIDELLRRSDTDVAVAALDPRHPVRALLAPLLAQLDPHGEEPPAWPGGGIPSLHVTGWFDGAVAPTLDAWQAARRQGRDHHLVIGPWAHEDFGEELLGRAHPGGSAAAAGLVARQLGFLDHYVRGVGPRPPVAHVYVTGAGASEWRTSDAWPPPCDERELFPAGGRLERSCPDATSQTTIVSRADDPLPSRGGPSTVEDEQGRFLAGPADVASLTRRDDVAWSVSEPFEQAVELAGRPLLEARVEADRAPAGLVAKLADVAPDGSAHVLCDGVAVAQPPACTSVRLELTLSPLHHRLAPGHRLGLLLSAAESPRYLIGLDADRVTSVLCGGEHATRLRLPVVRA